MTILASEITAELGKQLNDVGQVTWTEESLVEYINSAQNQIVSMRPDAYSVVTVVQMIAGSKQDLPVDTTRLLNVKRNMGTDGLTPGRAVWPCEMEDLDLFNFGWHNATQEQEIKNFMYSEKSPRTFYVDPPSDGTGYIEISVSRVPPLLTTPVGVQALDVKDIYRNHVIQWCMFRAYSIEVDSASSQQRAGIHYGNFMDMMGRKFQRDVQFSPSVEIAPVQSVEDVP